MRIELREDVAVPIEAAFAAAADVAGWERQAMRRGAQVRRLDAGPDLAPGAAWRVAFRHRGRERVATTELTRLDAPRAAAARVEGEGMAGTAAVELLALGPGTTRVAVTLDLEARTLAARLLLQSMRLAQGLVRRRAAERVGAWARDVEARWRKRR